jgi:hypothetical protein
LSEIGDNLDSETCSLKLMKLLLAQDARNAKFRYGLLSGSASLKVEIILA